MLQYGRYLLYLTVYATVQTVSQNRSIALPLETLILDSLIQGAIMILLGVLIWKVLMHGNFEALTIIQKLTNLLALGLISITVWLITGYSIEHAVYNKQVLDLFIRYLPTRTIIGIFSYLFLIQRFQLQLLQIKIKNKESQTEEKEDHLIEKGTTKNQLERVTVKSGTKIHVVETSNILYLQADGDYVQIHTTDGNYLKEQTMKYFEEQLPGDKFVRVHRSTIVNVEMISRIELHEKLSQQLTLKNGEQIKTSVAGYKALKHTLKL